MSVGSSQYECCDYLGLLKLKDRFDLFNGDDLDIGTNICRVSFGQSVLNVATSTWSIKIGRFTDFTGRA